MFRRKMPANGKASNGSTSLLYDNNNNNNSITDHNNNHLGNSLLFNNQNNESEHLSNHNSPNNFQIKKERFNSDLNDQSSQCNEDLNEDEQLNDLDDNLNNSATSTPTASTTPNNTSNNSTQQLQNQLQQSNKRMLNNSTKLTNGALQSSPLNMFTESSKLLNHLNSLNLTKNDNLLKNNKDGDSLLENLNLSNLNLSLGNLSNIGNISSLNLSSFGNLQNLTQFSQLSQLSGLNQLQQFNQQPENDYDSVLMNANEEDDENSSNMIITPDITDYASYNDDDLDEQIQTSFKQQQHLANTMDDDEDLDNDLLNEMHSKDDREGCRSLICDSNGIIIAEMVYRCMVCANISDSITDAQNHYQLKHVLHQNMNSLNNFGSNNWKSNSANSSRSSNSSLQAQIKNQNFLKKQRQSKLHQIQQIKIQQERIQQINRIKKEQKIKEQKNNQRLLQMHLQQQQQNQHHNQLQLQQNQRLEQLRQQKINGLNELAQMQSQTQSNDNNGSPSQLQSNVSNTVADINNLFLNNPPLPGTVAKTPQTAHGSSRGGYVTCAVCSITKFYASVQRRYGQFTCMGCAKFFGRFLAKPKKFNCPNLGSCALNTSPRCKACLLLACINTYTIDEKRKQVVNANRPVQRSTPSGPALIGRASDSAKRKSAAAKLAQQA